MPNKPKFLPHLSGSCGRVRCEPGWYLDAAWATKLADFDLWLVWAGQGTLLINGRPHALRPGTAVWMRPGTRYTARHHPDDRLGVTFTHFTLPHAPADFRPPFETTAVRSLDFAAATFAEVVRLRADAPDLAPALFGALLAVLVADDRRQRRLPPAARFARGQALQSLAARISAEPGQPWHVATLARETGYAVDHFSKAFAAVTGLRPQAFIVRARLDRARHLLAETPLNITEIATALGYRDVYFFSRQFRAKCGLTPTEYRRSRDPGALPAQPVPAE